MKKIAVLAVNYVGNVGDLFILRSVLTFLNNKNSEIEIDVYPYPLRFDRRIASAELLESEFEYTIKEPLFAIYKSIDNFSRRFNFIKKILLKSYFQRFGKVFRSLTTKKLSKKYDLVISVGGEMDIPYSLFDIHDYIRSNIVSDSTQLIYGPISITPNNENISFLKDRFKETKSNIFIRDPNSLKWLNKIGVSNVELVPDCAFLSWKEETEILERKSIGICLHSSWQANFDKAIEIIESSLSIAEEYEQSVILYCTHLNEDYKVMNFLKTKYANAKNIQFIIPKTSLEFISLSESCELIISDRLHAILVGLIHGAKILPLATRHKVKGYCDYIGLDNFIQKSDSENSIENSIRAVLDDQSLKNKLKVFAQHSHKQITTAYDSKYMM